MDVHFGASLDHVSQGDNIVVTGKEYKDGAFGKIHMNVFYEGEHQIVVYNFLRYAMMVDVQKEVVGGVVLVGLVLRLLRLIERGQNFGAFSVAVRDGVVVSRFAVFVLRRGVATCTGKIGLANMKSAVIARSVALC